MSTCEKIEKFISKVNLKKILSELLKSSNLIAPVNLHGERVFQEIKSIETIVFDYENCLNAPKDFVLLNDEMLFKYDLKKSKIKKTNYSSPEIVIFGSRACDTRAVRLLDKFFSRKPEDPLYLSKRKNIFIITLMCKKLWQNCFCTSTHTGPYLEEKIGIQIDIQLIEIEGGYFLEAGSVKGKRFVKRFSNLLTDISKDKKLKVQEAVKKAKESKDPEFNLKEVYNNLDNLDTKKELWEDLSKRCQSCGGCLLICPTCSCFYVVDKKIDDKEGFRVRSLDACFYEGFTRLSGPYNPIGNKDIMMKRKFYHKLHQQINEFASSGCTGCGRCNEICPGNINWLKVIKRIEKISV